MMSPLQWLIESEARLCSHGTSPSFCFGSYSAAINFRPALSASWSSFLYSSERSKMHMAICLELFLVQISSIFKIMLRQNNEINNA